MIALGSRLDRIPRLSIPCKRVPNESKSHWLRPYPPWDNSKSELHGTEVPALLPGPLSAVFLALFLVFSQAEQLVCARALLGGT